MKKKRRFFLDFWPYVCWDDILLFWGSIVITIVITHILYREDGSKRLADNTLVALTLMIAESKTEEKDVMVKVVVNLINQQNE